MNTREHLEHEAAMKFEPRPYQQNIFKMLADNPDVKPPMLLRQRGKHYVGIDYGFGDDKTVVSHFYKHKGRIFMYVDEYDSFPVYKWWRNPIQWFRWKRTMRLLSKQYRRSQK